MRKVLVLGGYGNFGRRISEALLKANIPVTIAGHNIDKANSLCSQLKYKYEPNLISAKELEVYDGIPEAESVLQNHQLVINTCGPFQGANYNIIEDCIKQKVHYIDLADGREFVTGIKQYDDQAKKAGISIISGASSVPGLSSAIIEKYKTEMSEIESVEYGISPGQKTTRGGIATVKGVMSYIGKPIKPFPGTNQPVYGWQDIYRENYPQIGHRWMANCEVPDLDILPLHYNIKNIRFSAGMESSILHLGIWFVSWLIRLGLPINLPNHADFLHRFSHWGFDWMGTDEGGLHMTLKGKDLEGKPYRRKWYIIVKKGDGPNVPTIPAIILGRKICKGQLNLTGFYPCVGLVSLEEYLREMNEFATTTYTYKY